MLISLVGLVIAAGIGAYIFLPYFLGWDEEQREHARVLEDSHEALMTQLADLEYDFRAGKLLEADYDPLRRELEVRLMAAGQPGGEQRAAAQGEAKLQKRPKKKATPDTEERSEKTKEIW